LHTTKSLLGQDFELSPHLMMSFDEIAGVFWAFTLE